MQRRRPSGKPSRTHSILDRTSGSVPERTKPLVERTAHPLAQSTPSLVTYKNSGPRFLSTTTTARLPPTALALFATAPQQQHPSSHTHTHTMSYTTAAAPSPSMCYCAGYVLATHSTSDEGPPLTTPNSPSTPRIIMTPCPRRCAILSDGVYYPATILNAPRIRTIPLPEPYPIQLPTPPPSPQSTTVANRRLR
jgi:hypothetical protein